LILCLLSLGAFCEQRFLREEHSHYIKNNSDWESYDWHENPFKDYTEDQINSLFGTTLQWTDENMNMMVDDDDHNMEGIPEEFDSRTVWPDCMRPVRAQEHCGSCWAFSGSSALADRFCIASDRKIKVELSPQDMVSCDTSNFACKGGLLDRTWNFFEKVGIVTEDCFKYLAGDGRKVAVECHNGACDDITLKYNKFRAVRGSSGPLSCPSQIKKNMVQFGPAQTGFMVWEDFMHYKSGIYKKSETPGRKMGGHAVKIIGWGTENGVEYWIAQNSWGPTWGENGFFRIAVGECQFDANAYAGEAKVDDFTPFKFLTFDS